MAQERKGRGQMAEGGRRGRFNELANSASRGSLKKENCMSSRAWNTSAGNIVFLLALMVRSFALFFWFHKLVTGVLSS